MSPPATSLLIDRDLPEHHEAGVSLRGRVPSWLRGSLVRTAAASFREGTWRAAHLFDALTALYAFDFAPDGSVRYRQRQLDSELRRHLRAGDEDTPHFYTSMRRRPLTRLLSPVPRGNDNTNVNVAPLDAALVAMTETQRQHEIDPGTLQTRGLVRYEDELGSKLFMLAHPRLDHARGRYLNLATMLGRKSGLAVYEHEPAPRRRRLLATLPMTQVPYMHSFGLTPREAVLFAGPFSVEPWRLLWSERGYIRHFRFRPERGSTIYRVDRASGHVRTHHAPPLFVFHVINAFERAEGEVVLDVLAYDDPGVIDTLTTEALRTGWPELAARPLRLTLRNGHEQADLQPLGDARFEFPSLHGARAEGQPYQHVWGTSGGPRPDGYESALVRLDVERGSVARFSEPGFLFGEPVFVPRPSARHEADGVLLSVANHLHEPRSALALLDAESLHIEAWGELPLVVPFSLHGSFLTARS